jgi:hypothetical protein
VPDLKLLGAQRAVKIAAETAGGWEAIVLTSRGIFELVAAVHLRRELGSSGEPDRGSGDP